MGGDPGTCHFLPTGFIGLLEVGLRNQVRYNKVKKRCFSGNVFGISVWEATVQGYHSIPQVWLLERIILVASLFRKAHV